MKVERSTARAKFLHEITKRYNARYNELREAGLSPDDACDKATAEIITPELHKRTKTTTIVSGGVDPVVINVKDWSP